MVAVLCVVCKGLENGWRQLAVKSATNHFVTNSVRPLMVHHSMYQSQLIILPLGGI